MYLHAKRAVRLPCSHIPSRSNLFHSAGESSGRQTSSSFTLGLRNLFKILKIFIVSLFVLQKEVWLFSLFVKDTEVSSRKNQVGRTFYIKRPNDVMKCLHLKWLIIMDEHSIRPLWSSWSWYLAQTTLVETKNNLSTYQRHKTTIFNISIPKMTSSIENDSWKTMLEVEWAIAVPVSCFSNHTTGGCKKVCGIFIFLS